MDGTGGKLEHEEGVLRQRSIPSIEEVYNEKRVHTGIDYLTPSGLEEGIKTDPSFAGRFVLQL